MTTISDELAMGVVRGIRRLDPSAARDLRQFLASQIDPDTGFFRDRAGRPDLYYTAFGLLIDLLADFRLSDRANILRRLKIKKPGGMIIVSVSPGSLAEKAKVPNGALIIRVGGIETPGKKEYIAARNESSLSDGIKLDLVLPGGKEQQTTVKLQ